jgi:undecaprenyl-diphosphatase
MRIVTGLGGSGLLIPLVVVLGLWYRRRAGSWRPLALLGSAYVGALLLSNGLKELADRGRPPAALAIGHYDSPAFPSGHATHAAAVWVMVGVVLASSAADRRRRVATWVAVATVVVVVGVSRLYLAAHWLTDVLAGWAIGGLWALTMYSLLRPCGKPVGK